MGKPPKVREHYLGVVPDEDFGNICISALRYALGRRTYITSLTSDYLIEQARQHHFSSRVLTVMLQDLRRYFDDRETWEIKDDDCDYDSWCALHKELEGESFRVYKEHNI